MKKYLLSFVFVAGGFMFLHAQVADTLITFEAESDTTGWMIFANGADPTADDVTVVENPDTMGINKSEMALRFVVNDDADPWAGMVLHDKFVGDSAIAISAENFTISMMVYRSTLGNVGLKLESGVGGASNVEVVVQNTVVDEWELLTFDFTEVIGSSYEALVIFPDFPEARMEGAEVYIDNIVFTQGPATSAPLVEKGTLKVYPNPVRDKLYVQKADLTGYTISNTLGQVVEKVSFTPTSYRAIDVSKLKTGIHFITVDSNSGSLTTRFIKK